MRQSVTGSILTPQGWLRGRINWRGGVISAVDGKFAKTWEGDGPRVIPGYIDLHVHGGGGGDFMGGTMSVQRAAMFHARRGTTALAPTLMTAPAEAVSEVLASLALAKDKGESGAELLGAHLEGPFISRKRLGAQPDHTVNPDVGMVRAWAREFPVRIMTVAPELPGAMDLIGVLSGEGIRIQIGHTDASCETARQALEAGARGFTHLFNAMSPFAHRGGGAALCALGYGKEAEMICDGHHVEEAAFRAAKRAIASLYAVSDANPAAGMPDGQYFWGGRETLKRGGMVFLADGKTFAGSALAMHDMRACLLGLGLDELETTEMLSSKPAACLGLDKVRGTLEIGKIADLVVLNERDEIIEVYVRGKSVPAT